MRALPWGELSTACSSTPQLNPLFFPQNLNTNCRSPYAIRWSNRLSRMQKRHRRQTTDRRICDDIRRTSPKNQRGSRFGHKSGYWGSLGERQRAPWPPPPLAGKSACGNTVSFSHSFRWYFTAHKTRINMMWPNFSVTSNGG